MRLAFRLPGGVLKIKSYNMLRSVERDHRVPSIHIGTLHFIWWSNSKLERYSRGAL